MNLLAIAALDQHAHNVLRPEAAPRFPFVAAFSEAHDAAMFEHVRHTLFFKRSLRDIAELLECEATEESILERRMDLGVEQLMGRCIRAANLSGLLLDDGFLPDDTWPIAWHEAFVPVRRLLRLEWLAEQTIPQVASFADFVERFRSALTTPPANVVGFKSIAAYRTGLAISFPTYDDAAARFRDLNLVDDRKPFRLTDKTLIDFLLGIALEIASTRRLPVQFHTGFGDPDLDLRLANPLCLRPILEERRFRDAPVVLLHAAYPFTREAGYLASVYPNVFLDTGLAVPMLSTSGMLETLRQLLELAPISKVLYSSDAHFIPELFYLSAKHARAALSVVLAQAVSDGDLSAGSAERAAELILAGNARKLYHFTP